MAETEEPGEFVDGSNLNMFSQSTEKYLLKHLASSVVYLDISSNHMNEACSQLLADHLRSESCRLRSLSIVYCHLTHKCINTIFSAIGSSPLYEFYADNNLIDSENCLCLGNSFKCDPPLELLSVVGCQIDTTGFIQLFSGITSSTHIKHLRFDSNSMMETGANALADIIPILKLETLGISDNEIWQKGTTSVIQACMVKDTIYSLDIGYNQVNLDQLARYVQTSKTLRCLGISGSKVYEEQLNNFLNVVGNSQIQTFLIEGINFHFYPISWNRATENVFSNPSHMDALLFCINSNYSLDDLRLGFLELEQLMTIYRNWRQDRKLTLSLHNFGKTHNTWLIHFPNFDVESPCNQFFWNSKLYHSGIPMLNLILNKARFNKKRLTEISLKKTKINDECFSKIFPELVPYHYTSLNLENTDFRNTSIDSLIDFLKKDDAYIDELYLEHTKASAMAYQTLFQFFNDNLNKCPKILHFKMEGGKSREENSMLDYSKELGKLIGKNPPLVELKIIGSITGLDAINMINRLHLNHTLKSLDIQSDFFDRYKSPYPKLDDSVLLIFNDFIEILSKALLDMETQCVLEKFSFPLLTELFLGFVRNISMWPPILKQIETNYNTHQDQSSN